MNFKHFFINIHNFSYRYGDCHPVFFIGSLEAAFQEAFYVKARDVSPAFLILIKIVLYCLPLGVRQCFLFLTVLRLKY